MWPVNAEKLFPLHICEICPFYRLTRNTASSWQRKNFCDIWRLVQNSRVSIRRICSFLICVTSGSMRTHLPASTRVSPSEINSRMRVRQSVQPFPFTSPLDIHALFKVSLPPFPGGLLREFFNVKGNGNALWLLEIRLLICYCKLKLFVFKPQLFCFNSPTSQTLKPIVGINPDAGAADASPSPTTFCRSARHESESGKGHCSLRSHKLKACKVNPFFSSLFGDCMLCFFGGGILFCAFSRTSTV